MAAKRTRLKKGRPASGRRVKKPLVLFVVGGERTEKEYVERVLKPAFPEVAMLVKSKGVDPVALAGHASALTARERGDYAAVFVVTDVDEFSPQQLQNARKLCDGSRLRLVVNNPCFEVWLIDHAVTCSSACCDSAMAQKRSHDLGLTDGRKGKGIVADALAAKLDLAYENALASRSDKTREARAQLSKIDEFVPWTDMPEVMDELRRLARRR